MKDLDTDPSATQELITPSGAKYDLNNLTGKKKIELVMEGEATSKDFIAPSNMPGKKLAEMRAAHETTMDNSIREHTKGKPKSNIKVGDTILFKNWRSEVVEVDEVKGIKFRKGDKVSGWVHTSKVEKVDEPTGDD